jgi:hypothetical protein
LFFIISALLAPIGELIRSARGQSSRAAWADVGRQFTLAVSMIIAVDLTIRVAYVLLAAADLGDAPAGSLTALPLLPIGITAALLAVVLAGAKGMQLASRLPTGPPAVPRAWPSRPRLLIGTGAVFAVWFALLFLGASQLSTLSGQRNGDEREAPPEAGVVAKSERSPGNPAAVDSGPGPISTTSAPNSAADPTRSAQDFTAAGVATGPANGAQGGTGVGEAPPGAVSTGPNTQPAPGSQVPSTSPGQAQAGAGPPDSAGPPDAAGPPSHSQGQGSGPPETAGPPDAAGPAPEPRGRQPSTR